MQTVETTAEVIHPVEDVEDVQDGRETTLAKINETIDLLDGMADAAEQLVDRLIYGWGAAKYRRFSAHFEVAESHGEESDLMSEIHTFGEALELAAASLGNPLASPDLAEIKEAAKGAKMSRVVQESLRADLSLFLVRRVQDVVEVTENSLAGWQSDSSARPTPDEVRMVFRRHAANVLDLLQLLPGCDLAQATADIERSIDLIDKDTAHQLNMLATDEAFTLH